MSISRNSPTERAYKKILVSVWNQGKWHWALVNAHKFGNEYKISTDAYNGIVSKSNNR